VTNKEASGVIDKPLVGVGSCLVGQPVRFNGDHKRRNPHIETFADHLELLPICPEVGIGMGVPRKPIRLVENDDKQLRAMDSDHQRDDFTDALQAFADRQCADHPQLCGYILVKGSPSCGKENVKRYNCDGNVIAADSAGIYAQRLLQHYPLLPVEDDGRLYDTGLRESFVERVFLYHDWLQLNRDALEPKRLIGFYSRYKYQIMAHHVPSYKQLGRLLSDTNRLPIDELAQQTIELMMGALKQVATRASHTNALHHIQGYLKRVLSKSEKQELQQVIEQYHQGIVPLIVPITLLRHHFARRPDPYIEQQVFMAPYPDELALRSHLS